MSVKMKMKKKETYIMVWIHETERWHYFKEEFDESVFKDGYVDYKVRVEDGTIVDDEWSKDNEGKQFCDSYNAMLWEPALV